MRCLALTVYWEARGEPREGQLAVAHVVLNRLGRPGFANTVCGVVHQGGRAASCQFHWYCRGADPAPRQAESWVVAQGVALDALADGDPTNGAQYFHLASLRVPWAKGHYIGAKVIGHHVFFRRRALRVRMAAKSTELADASGGRTVLSAK